jgi:1-aminocyclopropane-1-carboxylate deaminase
MLLGIFDTKLPEFVSKRPFIPTESVNPELLPYKHVAFFIKRLDKIPGESSGNKYFKLKYNLQAAIAQGHTQVLTFGGAFSNHIHATSIAAKTNGLSSIGVIRGELVFPLNPTLSAAKDYGMLFHPISRSSYKDKYKEEHLKKWLDMYGDYYLIPEGGTNQLAIEGTKEILEESDAEFDFICTSIGTGGTFAGLYASTKNHQRILGFSALKGEFVHQEIRELLAHHKLVADKKYTLFSGYHFGGYGKINSELIQFMRNFTAYTSIPLDPVYTGKMMFGILDLIQQGFFPKGSKILAIHSGGLQGIPGMEQRHNLKIYP